MEYQVRGGGRKLMRECERVEVEKGRNLEDMTYGERASAGL